MNGEARRDEIVRMLTESSSPLAGVTLAKHFDVSRQVIVQDIALLRANGFDIFSTNRGYLMQGQTETTRVFKVYHADEDVEKELRFSHFRASASSEARARKVKLKEL